jgi:translation initiation factor IF-2
LRQTYAICAGLVAIGLAGAEPAAAQLLAYPPAGNMPAYEVVTLVRSTGLEPVGHPVRRGPAYVLHAVNPSGREFRVIVDARLRRIMRVVPTGPVRAAAADVPPPPAPYGRPPADITGVPEGNGPGARVVGLPPDVDEAEPYPAAGQTPYGQVAAVGTMPVAPRTPAARAAPVTSQAAPPPLPRPRPKLAAAEPTAPLPATASSTVVPVVTGSTDASAATGSTVQPAGPVQPKGIGASAAAELPVYEPIYEQYE